MKTDTSPRRTRSSGAREPRQARSRATRGTIIQAAARLIEKRGFERTSMADIAQEASIATGTLYHHFPDKRALLLELIEEWGQRLAADRRSDLQLDSFLGDDPRGALSRFLRCFYERLTDRTSLYAAISPLVYQDPELNQRADHLRHAGAERFAALIEFGQARGLFRPELNPTTASFLMLNASELLATHVLKLQRSEQQTQVLLEAITDMLSRYLLVDA